MNKQEIYNKVKAHLLSQNKKSLAGKSCRYRDYVGRKCAIGALIPDALYSLDMEGQSIGALLLEFPGLCEVFGMEPLEAQADYAREDVLFLQELQSVHDIASVRDWKEQLAMVADAYELSDE